MKKIIVTLLALVMMLSLTACGGKNIEQFCDGADLRWNGAASSLVNDAKYYASFEDGVLTIVRREQRDVPPAGLLWMVVETQTYNYELEGNDTIIIEGLITYKYEIHGDEVVFDENLVGLDNYWVLS